MTRAKVKRLKILNGSDKNTDTDKKDTDETEKPADDKKDPDKTEKPTDDKKDAEDKKDDTSKKEEPKKEGSDKKDDTSKKEDTSEKEPVGSLWDKATDVKISGDFIPSYVEVRVSVNTDLDSMPKADIEQILQAYEIKLWDLKADKKYTIPDGKKVTVSIPVPKDADLYKKLLIGHYIEETGNYEYFTLGTNMNVVDGYLVFETGSLSPFNVGAVSLWESVHRVRTINRVVPVKQEPPVTAEVLPLNKNNGTAVLPQ